MPRLNRGCLVLLRRVRVDRLVRVVHLILVRREPCKLLLHSFAIVVVFFVHFFDGSKVLFALHLEVSFLGICDDFVDAVDLEAVRVNL